MKFEPGDQVKKSHGHDPAIYRVVKLVSFRFKVYEIEDVNTGERFNHGASILEKVVWQ